AITLYQDEARAQQIKLLNAKASPERAAAPEFWALNSVGTGFFIIGDSWMLLSYDYRGAERAAGMWQKAIQLADIRQSEITVPAGGRDAAPTNAAGCRYYAQRVFASLLNDYPYAHLRESDGTYRQLSHAVQTRFPELTKSYLELSWRNALIFTGGLFVFIV